MVAAVEAIPKTSVFCPNILTSILPRILGRIVRKGKLGLNMLLHLMMCCHTNSNCQVKIYHRNIWKKLVSSI
jgi:hypothetical protein